MTRNLIVLLPLALLVLTSTAFAHDPSMHHGPIVQGEVTAVTTEGLELKTDKGPLHISFSPATKFELGDEGKSSSKSDLSVGQHLMVSGHKLETGELVATEVMIHGARPDASEEQHRTH